VFRFWETPAGKPKAIRAWFYPGDNFGQEFAYPKMKSVEFARTANTEVPTILMEKDAVDLEGLKTAPIVIVTEKGEEKPLVLMARNDAPAQSTSDAAFQSRDATTSAKTLPHTATSMPLVGLTGMALLAAFGLITFFSGRKRGLSNENSLEQENRHDDPDRTFPLREPRGRPDELYRNWCEHLPENEWADGTQGEAIAGSSWE
jgi:hypothetical protein